MEDNIQGNFESSIAEIKAESMHLKEKDKNTINEVKSLRAEMIQMKSENETLVKMIK
jgi:hypothetical protein